MLINKTWKLSRLMCNGKPLRASRLMVQTDLSEVKDVLQWFEEFTSEPLPQEFWQQCQIALVEGFTNVVRHAHRHLPNTTVIELELKLFTDGLEMRLWDYGHPFDFQSKLESLYQEDYDPLEKEGGRGLMFMNQLTDEVSYQRLSDQRNCLLMRKWC
ncbi:ATP-binding protein [Moorena producens]|nr:ATP-binding protein [Moorena producens]